MDEAVLRVIRERDRLATGFAIPSATHDRRLLLAELDRLTQPEEESQPRVRRPPPPAFPGKARTLDLPVNPPPPSPPMPNLTGYLPGMTHGTGGNDLTPVPGLDAALAEAEAALPEQWLIGLKPTPGGYMVGAGDVRYEWTVWDMQRYPSPVAALRALGADLVALPDDKRFPTYEPMP